MDNEIDLSNNVLETDRLILRPWNASDLNDLYEYASVDGVGEAAGWKHHASPDESVKILQSFIADKNIFAIVYKENNKVIGSLGLHKIDPSVIELESKKAKEIGYVISKDYWGKGIATEAVNKVIEFSFGTLKLDALTVGHFLENNRSKRVIEKCGFEFLKMTEFTSTSLNKVFKELYYVRHNTAG